jgi:Flp pilus assembly protein CpaB
VLTEADITWRTLPDDAVGPAAITEADAPIGRVVAAPVDADEVISRRRLAPDGLRGLAALVPEGSVAVAVARDENTPPLERGQRVEVLSAAGVDPVARPSANGAPGAVEATRVATGALVIDVGDDRVLLAIGREDAPGVAAAVLDGAVVLALTRA